MTTTKTEEKPQKQATPTLCQVVKQYARLKRVEKRLKDKLDTAKAQIIAYGDSKEYILVFNDEKLASVSEETRTTLDAKALALEKPKIFKQYAKESEPFFVVRTH